MRKRIISCMFLVVLLVFSACSGEEQPIQSGQNKENTEPSVVSDLLCEDVYVEEANGLKPYIVSSTDYNGTTLLLRKHILNDTRRMNDHYSSYENCEMDKFLNREFYNSFPEITKGIILETEIESCQRDHMWASRPLKSNLIKRKIFLLSGTETNNDDIVVAPTEGKVLEYFNVNILHKAGGPELLVHLKIFYFIILTLKMVQWGFLLHVMQLVFDQLSVYPTTHLSRKLKFLAKAYM